MSWFKRLFSHQTSPARTSSPEVAKEATGQKYFEVPVQVSVFRCSDRQCSCPGTESLVPGETGYLFISSEVVEMRKDALTMSQLQAKAARTGAIVYFDTGTIYPIFMCRQAAENRGLDLAVAGADARQWIKTGRVPLRVTPKRAG